MMPRNQVWCVVGRYLNDYSKINYDAYCDFAMAMWDTQHSYSVFADDSNYTWFLDQARDAKRASFAIATYAR